MDISVLVVNLNNLEFTKDCVSDLMSQDCNFNLTIIDQNSSEEGTKEYFSTLPENIEFIQNDYNVNLNQLWNWFVLKSNTPYICLLNNDVRIAPNFLSSAIQVLEKEPNVGFVNHISNNKDYQVWSFELNYKIIETPYRQGWDPIFRKESYNQIPNELSFFYGDDYIYSKLYSSGMKGAYVLNSPMIHFERSTTVEKGGQRDASPDNLYFHQLDLEFKNMSFVEELSKWKPEFNKINIKKKLHKNMEIDYIINQGVEIKGIIQVGANTGQEISEYKNYTQNIMCFEPINEVIATLKQNHPDVLSYNIALGKSNECQTMYLASNNFESSSFLKPNNHILYYPHITFENTRNIRIFRFDCLGIETKNKYNILKSDTQGFELQVLKGFGKELSNFDAICVEFIDSNQYENDSSLSKIQDYLEPFGFKFGKVLTELNGSGDVIFIKKKEFRIICDGGLGNRINSLISGLIISDMLGYTPYVHWSPNNWCGCKLDEIFTPDFNYDDKSITKIHEEFPNHLYLIHANQLNKEVDIIYINDDISSIYQSKDRDIIYYNSLIPEFINQEDLIKKLKSLKIKEDILKNVLDFCESNKIGKSVDGVHIRMTDFPENIKVDELLDYVSSSNSKTFVCSDDKECELKFLNYSNVITLSKNSYATKMDINLGWNDLTQDTEGRYFNFNVNRSSESALEAFKDLLILSRTNIIKTSNTSTFLKLSTLYSNIKLN